MQSILGILYPVSRMQNFYIRLYVVDFRYFVKLSTSHMQNFCIKLDAVNFRHFVFSFPDAKFLHLSLMHSILGISNPVSQMQNFCIVP